jgi:HEPN domain-containing protein
MPTSYPNRAEFQALAVERLEDAKSLIAAGRYAGAYYLAGYAVECALKACISKQTIAGDFPPPWQRVRDGYYTHDIRALLRTSGLESAQVQAAAADAAFARNWLLVVEWGEEVRYQSTVPSADAQGLMNAIDDPVTGVLTWLQMHW